MSDARPTRAGGDRLDGWLAGFSVVVEVRRTLQLEVAYQPADKALDVALTLFSDVNDQTSQHETSEDWSVHPALHHANPRAIIETCGSAG